MRILHLIVALLASVGGSWVDDGSGLTSAVDNEVKVLRIPYPGDTKVNAQWSEGVDSGTHYWEVEVDAAKMSLGLTSAQSFGPKYRIRGYFYNGNLSDGAGGLRFRFGPSLLPGDRVGMLVEFDETMKVWFFVNGQPLGLAFDVPLPAVMLHPTVSFKVGGSSATIAKKDPPTNRDDPEKPTGISGKWLGMFDGHAVSLRLKELEGGYQGSAKLLNTVQLSFIRNADESYSSILGATTDMAGPPEMMQAERNLMVFLASVRNVEMNGAETVILSGDMMNLIFTRDLTKLMPVNDVLIIE